ncbi:MAG: hypothetical protein ACLU9S_22710 [Oscillospiraceae bacterium]
MAMVTGLEKHAVTFDPCTASEFGTWRRWRWSLGASRWSVRRILKAEGSRFQGLRYTADNGTAWDFDAPVEPGSLDPVCLLAPTAAVRRWFCLWRWRQRKMTRIDALSAAGGAEYHQGPEAVMPAKVRDGIVYIVDTVTMLPAPGGRGIWPARIAWFMRWSDCLTDMIDADVRPADPGQHHHR